ncbi:putative plasmid replication-associated protein [Burkholderia lata]|uniref:replication initiator protein A n=1 Tax=Burkholderia lata (strain ATCC 17760 / DSM 23089 / LMG 22485 / NCIMB 9086 / R18194 / 383) TaxID=482957 RepID=UPI001453F3BB|nr:replication initiator protein A [Burkholderia lata]VWC10855.1 putative plasmid replication-associated protein [Burkholderia lata]
MSASKALALCQQRSEEALDRIRRNRELHELPANTTATIADSLPNQPPPNIEKSAFNKTVSRAHKRGPANDVLVSGLSPIRHAQQDFFVADIFDAALKDDLASMEHPLFALRAGDRRVRRYEHNGKCVVIKPGHDGCATIHDKDLWIYCISQLVEAMNRGRKDVSRTVRFTAYDFLVTTNRPTAGVGYQRMAEALGRLKGTVIETNIETDGKRERAGFGLIDAWRVIERDHDDRMVAVEVTLPDWLWRSVETKQILTLSREYFQLRKPLDRRIYELVRKHCGAQSKWRVTVMTLHNKSGTTGTPREFRRHIKKLANANEFPGYQVGFDAERDTATFYPRSGKGTKAQFDDLLGATVRSTAGGKTAERKTTPKKVEERQRHVKSRRSSNDEQSYKGLISVHTAGVTGSIPVPPTKEFKALRLTTQGLFVLAPRRSMSDSAPGRQLMLDAAHRSPAHLPYNPSTRHRDAHPSGRTFRLTRTPPPAPPSH